MELRPKVNLAFRVLNLIRTDCFTIKSILKVQLAHTRLQMELRPKVNLAFKVLNLIRTDCFTFKSNLKVHLAHI